MIRSTSTHTSDHVLEGYFEQSVGGHLAVDQNEHFYLPVDGHRLIAENNPLVHGLFHTLSQEPLDLLSCRRPM